MFSGLTEGSPRNWGNCDLSARCVGDGADGVQRAVDSAGKPGCNPYNAQSEYADALGGHQPKWDGGKDKHCCPVTGR